MLDLLKEKLTISNDGMFLVVLGPPSSGKTHFMGTYPGRTLLLHGSGESHSGGVASKTHKDLVAIRWDKDGKGKVEPKDMMGRIHQILDPEVLKKAGIKCIALDSLTALCNDAKLTPYFKQRCTTSKGDHNAFKESEALIEILGGIVEKLCSLHEDHGIDIIAAMDLVPLEIADDGSFISAKPGMATFGVARAVLQQFPERMIIGRVKGEPKFQCDTKVAAISKDRDTEVYKKYLDVHPQLKGVNEIPAYLEPTVKALMELKKK